MRKPLIRGLSFTAIVLLAWATSAAAQEGGLNRVADGGFESGWVSLSLPAAAEFPLFSGGWASRGARPPEIVAGDSFDGLRSLRIETRPDDPLQIVQDLALNGAAYGVHFAFFIEQGSQTVRLLDEWNRGDPGDGTPAFEARLSTAGIRVATPAGSWTVETEVSALAWHWLSVVADPRTGTLSLRLDGRLLMSLPGVDFLRRSTLVLAGGIADRGVFRYDAVEATSLIDLELAAIDEFVAALDVSWRASLLNRFAATRAALERGSSALALTELGVARNLLGEAGPVPASLGLAIAELMELIEASSEMGVKGSQARF